MAKTENNQESLDSIKAEIAKLQARAEEILRAEKAEAIATAKELVRKYEITARDLGLAGNSENFFKKPRKSAEAKYRDAQSGATWSGRGRKPKWVEDALAAGRTLDDLKI